MTKTLRRIDTEQRFRRTVEADRHIYYKWSGGVHSPLKIGSRVAVLYQNNPVPFVEFADNVEWAQVAEFCILSGETNDGTMLMRADCQYA